MPREVIITEWALQSYLSLVACHVFSTDEYWDILRPDVLRLKVYSTDSRFKDSNFWGPATLNGGRPVENGFKMKWHNIGPGKVQLRVCVAIIKKKSYLCQAFVKGSELKDKREAALLLSRIDLIEQGRFEYRGSL